MLPLNKAITAAIDLRLKLARLNVRHGLVVVFIDDNSRLINSKGVVVKRDQPKNLIDVLFIFFLKNHRQSPVCEGEKPGALQMEGG